MLADAKFIGSGATPACIVQAIAGMTDQPKAVLLKSLAAGEAACLGFEWRERNGDRLTVLLRPWRAGERAGGFRLRQECMGKPLREWLWEPPASGNHADDAVECVQELLLAARDGRRANQERRMR
jgi:hypothetical protein